MKLIYHNIDKPEQYSPFDKELVHMANGQSISIVSPYIGLDYLKRIIQVSKSWRLITDFQEWILSHSTQKQRVDICNFINQNSDNIKHVKNVHAKVLVTNESVLLGSANFTNSGMLKRTEMSVSFTEKEKVEEINIWFNKLWEISTDFSPNKLDEFIKSNATVDYNQKVVRLSNDVTAKNRRTSLFPVDNLSKSDIEYEHELKEAIDKQKDKMWLNNYFNFVKKLFTELGIQENSMKITMSVTESKKMPITIGQRYIARLKGESVRLILPLSFEEENSDYPDFEIVGSFSTNKRKQALWGEFKSKDVFFDNYLYNEWKNAAENELNRTSVSGFRRAHNPYYYKVVMDTDYRKDILKIK